MHRGRQERPTGYFKDKSYLGKQSRFSALRKSRGKVLSQLSIIYAFQGRWKQVAVGRKNNPAMYVLITRKPDNWEGEGSQRTSRAPGVGPFNDFSVRLLGKRMDFSLFSHPYLKNFKVIH